MPKGEEWKYPKSDPRYKPKGAVKSGSKDPLIRKIFRALGLLYDQRYGKEKIERGRMRIEKQIGSPSRGLKKSKAKTIKPSYKSETPPGSQSLSRLGKFLGIEGYGTALERREIGEESYPRSVSEKVGSSDRWPFRKPFPSPRELVRRRKEAHRKGDKRYDKYGAKSSR